jgi:ADP-heptose:LPS heptosyltransferase
MKVASLQKIDRWLGVPLCFALTLFRKMAGQKSLPQTKTVRNILFVKLAEQGSTVLAYPAIRRAVEIAGRENVYFVVFNENRFILDALELIPRENVITISFNNFGSLLGSTLSALKRMRALKFEAAIDMEFFARGSAAVAFLSGARRRIGFHSFFGAGPYRGDLMTHHLLYNPYLHTSQIFLQMVEAVRLDGASLPTFPMVPPHVDEELPRFRAAPGEIGEVKCLLQREIGKSELPPTILLNPNASDLLPLRRWEPSRYVELARRLLKAFPEACVAMTGGPGEGASIEQLAREVGSPRCVSLAGKTTLRQLLILYSFAEVLVTNDSGPAHFAALTPIHVITLFGPETPRLFSARTPRNTPLWMGIGCSPCVNAYNNRQTTCRNNLCMQLITVDHVFEEVSKVYSQRRSSPLKISNG